MHEPSRSSRRGGDRRPELSLIIPAYNEQDRLTRGLERLQGAAADGAVDLEQTEVLWVDDGSSDATSAVAASLARELPRASVLRLEENLGKGAAVRAGVAAAMGRAVAFGDADMSIDPRALSPMLGVLRHADVAIGSRASAGRSITYASKLRTIGGRVFNRAVRVVSHLDVADTQCGLKAFTAPAAKLLFALGTIDRFAFDVEVLSRARRLGLEVAEVPVRWEEVAGSSIRPLRDPLSMLGDLLAARAQLKVPRPISGYTLETASSIEELSAQLGTLVGSSNVVVGATSSGTIVLLPFAHGPLEAERNAHLRAGLVSPSVRARYFSPRDLAKLAPIRLAHEVR